MFEVLVILPWKEEQRGIFAKQKRAFRKIDYHSSDNGGRMETVKHSDNGEGMKRDVGGGGEMERFPECKMLGVSEMKFKNP
ncbi:uncharacterized protein HKW66_Vig0051340 [Vigna angularis]|nr:uncharacterized protein HKW66_Vig0051340 [Vigna angularis]